MFGNVRSGERGVRGSSDADEQGGERQRSEVDGDPGVGPAGTCQTNVSASADESETETVRLAPIRKPGGFVAATSVVAHRVRARSSIAVE